MCYSQSTGCDAWLAAWLVLHALAVPRRRRAPTVLVLDTRLDLDFQHLERYSASWALDFKMRPHQYCILIEFGNSESVTDRCPQFWVGARSILGLQESPDDIDWLKGLLCFGHKDPYPSLVMIRFRHHFCNYKIIILISNYYYHQFYLIHCIIISIRLTLQYYPIPYLYHRLRDSFRSAEGYYWDLLPASYRYPQVGRRWFLQAMDWLYSS